MTDPTESRQSEQSVARTNWPWWGRAAFRFAFIYWLLYILPYPGGVSLFDLLPWGTARIESWVVWPMTTLIKWAGVHVFHLTGVAATIHPTGSGDTALAYVGVACMATMALVGAVVWSAIDERSERRREYQTAYAWLRLLLRFTLAVSLLTYGFAKVFPEQFSSLTLYELTGTYGDSSPMHLLWTFMGASAAYTIFSGSMEVIAGMLLMFRRTSTVGALMAVGVMLNVVLLNFCYDVPVKLYSTHLLLMALFLLLPDVAALWRFLILRRSAELMGVWVARPERRALRMAGYGLQALVLIAALYATAWSAHRAFEKPAPKAALYGVWAVDSSEGTFPEGRWSKVILENRFALTFHPDGKMNVVKVQYNDGTQTIAFPKEDKSSNLHWTKDEAGAVTLTGTWDGSAAKVVMHKTSPDTFTLQTRGFHWVQEYPYNR